MSGAKLHPREPPVGQLTYLNFTQAAPVQNTYYVALEGIFIELHIFVGTIAAVGEDLQFRLTIDGNVVTSAATACAAAQFILASGIRNGTVLLMSASNPNWDTSYLLSQSIVTRGRAVRLEIRKTTANGAGALGVRGWYHQR